MNQIKLFRIRLGKWCVHLLLLAALLHTGSFFPVFAQERGDPAYTPEESRVMLRFELTDFEDYVGSTMKNTQRILRDRGVRSSDLKKFELWQKAQLERFSQALRQGDPLVALVDAWAVARNLTASLDQRESLGELPPSTREVALDMLKRREDRLAHIASRYLSEESVLEISREMDNYGKDQPIPKNEVLEPDSGSWTSPLFSAWSVGRSGVESLLDLPLMPGRALQGVSESGKALTGIRESTADAVRVAEELPERIRREFQIALDDLINKRAEILEIVYAVDSVSTNLRETAGSTHLATIGIQDSLKLAKEILPEGQTLVFSMEKTVTAGTELIRELDKLIAQKESAGKDQPGGSERFDITEYKAAAESLTTAAGEVRRMLIEIRPLVERDADAAENTQRFDIRDYDKAAHSVERGAAEIRSLLRELQALTEEDASTSGIARQSRVVVDHIAWRIVQVIALVFILACGHLALKSRLQR